MKAEIVSSIEEALEAMRTRRFPVLLVPWNSDESKTPQFLAHNEDDLKTYLPEALEYAVYQDKVHIIPRLASQWAFADGGILPS